MQHYRQHWPVLMLVPVSMTYQWAAELLKFSSDLLRDKDIFIAKKVCWDYLSCFYVVCNMKDGEVSSVGGFSGEEDE